MKISIVTITARSNPRLADMARTLHASWLRSNVDLEWIVVDEVDPSRAPALLFGLASEHGLARSENFHVFGMAPPASEHRKPGDSPDKRGVAHNSYRNAGLGAAKGDYVVFLNDCNVVTIDFVNVVRDIALRDGTGVGFKCKGDARVDLPVAADGVFKHRDHHDTFHEVPFRSAVGACWGAPAAAFQAIGGFDVAYDGQRRGNDLDAAIRLSRLGVKFYTTERAYVVQLERTKLKSEISTRPDVYAGKRNIELINQLVRDRVRTQPINGRDEASLHWHEQQVKEGHVVHITPAQFDRAKATGPVVVTQGTPTAMNAGQPSPITPPAPPPVVTRRESDGAYTAGPPPDDRPLQAHLDEMAKLPDSQPLEVTGDTRLRVCYEGTLTIAECQAKLGPTTIVREVRPATLYREGTEAIFDMAPLTPEQQAQLDKDQATLFDNTDVDPDMMY